MNVGLRGALAVAGRRPIGDQPTGVARPVPLMRRKMMKGSYEHRIKEKQRKEEERAREEDARCESDPKHGREGRPYTNLTQKWRSPDTNLTLKPGGGQVQIQP